MPTPANDYVIRIGLFESAYKAYETAAPEDYDGFGTISLHRKASLRWVLIRAEHEKWQVERYRSGVYQATPFGCETVGTRQQESHGVPPMEEVAYWITERLHDRLLHGSAKDE